LTSSIKDLVKKAQQGNLEAFDELVLIYQDRVFSHCCHLAGNPDDGQDLAQDVFIQAFKGLKSFRQQADLGTWLHRIAVNSWINKQRKNRKIALFSLDETFDTGNGEFAREVAVSEDSPLENIERQEFNDLVTSALNNIMPEFRVVLILREIEGYSYEEIAQILGCSLGTVKSRLNRGRRAMRAEILKLSEKYGFSD